MHNRLPNPSLTRRWKSNTEVQLTQLFWVWGAFLSHKQLEKWMSATVDLPRDLLDLGVSDCENLDWIKTQLWRDVLPIRTISFMTSFPPSHCWLRGWWPAKEQLSPLLSSAPVCSYGLCGCSSARCVCAAAGVHIVLSGVECKMVH